MQFITADLYYLSCSVFYVFLITVLSRLTLSDDHFRLTNFAGMINAPSGLFLYFLEDHYWNPHRWGGVRIGTEDLIISYAVSAIAWYTVAIIWQTRLAVRFTWSHFARRYLQIAGGGWLMYLVVVHAGLDPMTSLIAVCMAVALLLGWLNPRNWPLAVTGMTAFPVIWFLICWLTFLFLPETILRWNLSGIWGVLILGVPAGELIWAMVFGAFFPLLVGFLFNLRIGGSSIQAK